MTAPVHTRAPRSAFRTVSRLALTLSISLALPACFGPSSSWRVVPVTPMPEGLAVPMARVRIPLAPLRERLEGMDPARVTVFHTGREAIPHRVLDLDGDGTPDALEIAIPVPADGTEVLIRSPGEPGVGAVDESAPVGRAEARVELSSR